MHGNTEPAALNAKFEMRAFAANHQSEVVDRGRRCQADLISVGYLGARLRVPDREFSRAWREGHGLVLNLRIPDGLGLTENVPCAVRWMQGDDLGVDFARPLSVATHDLQGWLEN